LSTTLISNLATLLSVIQDNAYLQHALSLESHRKFKKSQLNHNCSIILKYKVFERFPLYSVLYSRQVSFYFSIPLTRHCSPPLGWSFVSQGKLLVIEIRHCKPQPKSLLHHF